MVAGISPHAFRPVITHARRTAIFRFGKLAIAYIIEIMKTWILGSGGLLGSALKNIASLENLVATTRHEVDIGDLSALRAFAKNHRDLTHIVNCAAFSQVDFAEKEREEALRVNAQGPANLALLSREIGAHFLHISTDYVFGGSLHRPLREEDKTVPCNYYGFTKLEGERRVMQITPSACILRTSWLFGHGGKNFVATLLDLLREREEISLTEDQWGRPTYVRDLAEVILQLRDASGYYQFANEGIANKYQFGLFMKEEAEKAGLPMRTKRILPVSGSTFSSPCKRPAYSAFDTTKIEKQLAIKIRSWKDALKDHIHATFSP